jgi:hypothetical protein
MILSTHDMLARLLEPIISALLTISTSGRGPGTGIVSSTKLGLMLAFRIMYEEWKEHGEESGLMAIKQTEYYDGKEKHLSILEEHPDVSARLGDLR